MNRRIFSTLWSLMQRELWESPGSFKWTPAGIIALTFFFVAVGLIFSLRVDNELVFTLDAIRQFSTVDMEQKRLDRKSTRLNSSHVAISYAVFCLKKKNDSSL